MTALYKTCIATLILSAMAPLTHAAELDLADCDILTGGKAAATYKSWLQTNGREADGGDREAIRNRAAVAGNVLACHEEKLTGDSGWGVIETTASGKNAGDTQSKLPPGIANIEKHAAAFKSLKDAVRYSHQAGAFDPGYRSISAQTVARYAGALPELLEQGYEDAAGAYEFDCVLKRAFGKRVTAVSCTIDRTTRAQLLPLVAPARRQALDALGRAWAEKVPAKGA